VDTVCKVCFVCWNTFRKASFSNRLWFTARKLKRALLEVRIQFPPGCFLHSLPVDKKYCQHLQWREHTGCLQRLVKYIVNWKDFNLRQRCRVYLLLGSNQQLRGQFIYSLEYIIL